MRNRLLLMLVAFLCVMLAQPAMAGKVRKTGGGGDDKSPDAAVTTVGSVDPANNKITLVVKDNNQSVTYLVTMGTTITIEGEPSELSQIHTGMFVVSFTEADSGTLSQLDVAAKLPKTN